MTTIIQKVSLTKEIEAELIAMSALWEQEDSCYGYRTNTAEDLKGQEYPDWVLTLDDALSTYDPG